MSHESWSVNFFSNNLFLFQISASWVGPTTHFWSSWDPCQHCCSTPTDNTRSSPNNLNGTWRVRKYFNFFLPITHYWRSVNFTVILTIPFCFRFQQVVPVLELIGNVVGSLVSLVVLLQRLIRICRRIWSILTARPPVVVANDHQNEVPLADINFGQNDVPPTDAGADATNGQNDVIVNKELNIWTHQKKGMFLAILIFWLKLIDKCFFSFTSFC